MEIVLARHGDPDYERDCLTNRGVWQAQRLAEYLDAYPLDAIYVSPLGRAQETCAFTAERQRISPITVDWLTDFFVAVDVLACNGDWSLSRGIMLPEGAEQSRVLKKGFDELLAGCGFVREDHLYRVERGCGKRVAMFCHKGVIQTLLSHMLNWPQPAIYAALEVNPAAFNHVAALEQNGLASFQALALNTTVHLRTPLEFSRESDRI